MSPSTRAEDCRVTAAPRITPATLPRTITRSAATVPVTLPCSPMMTSLPPTSPSISPSTCNVPWLMILRPWPMILRSLPITDLAFGSATLARRCCGAMLKPALALPLELGGSSGLGSAVDVRVNMEGPQGLILADVEEWRDAEHHYVVELCPQRSVLSARSMV